MYKIAVIGDRDSVLGFRALGLDVFFCDDAETGRKTLLRLAQQEYAVIYITEQLAQHLTAEIARYKDAPLPAIVSLPTAAGSTGYGMNAMRDAVERAVGVDILKEKE